MKKLLATTVGLLVCGSAFANHDIGVAYVNFDSYVNSNSCQVDNVSQTISLPSTSEAKLNPTPLLPNDPAVAGTASKTAFDLKLKNCPIGGFKKSDGTSVHDIAVFISDRNEALSSSDLRSKGLLVNSAQSSKAGNVYVQLLKDNNALPLQTELEETDTSFVIGQNATTNGGNITIPLVAQLYSPSGVDATAGKVEAAATVFFQYK